jgi:hypothetical protein
MTRKLQLKLLPLALALTALHAASGHAAEFGPIACQAQTAVDVTAIKPRVILIGELHGTEQAPAFVASLVCSLLRAGRPVILALERQHSEQPAIERYLASDGSAIERQALIDQGPWSGSIQDGRNSQGMLALIDSIRALRQGGQPVAILAMQHGFKLKVPDGRAPARSRDSALSSRMNDRFMADAIAGTAAEHGNYTLVALAGSFHTLTKAGSWAAPQHQPMGEVLTGLMPVFLIGLESAEGGAAWNCTHVDDCGAHRVGPMPMYAPGNPLDATVELGKLTASPPAKDTR